MTKYYKDRDGDIWIWDTETGRYGVWYVRTKIIINSDDIWDVGFYSVAHPGTAYNTKEITKEEAFLIML